MKIATSYLIFYSPDDKLQRREVLFSEFPDHDSHCVIEDIAGIKGATILVCHSLYPSQNDQIFKLLLLVDLLNDLGAKDVSVCVPYLPYARQDKRHIPGEAVSANVLSKVLHRSGIQHMFTFDCHFMKGEPHVIHNELSIYNYSLGDELIAACVKALGNETPNIIGPDAGSSYFVKNHGNKSMVKQRGDYGDLKKGNSYREVADLQHSHIQFDDNPVIIVDDMISTGGTILRAVENIRGQGVKTIYCVASHGLFLNGCYDKLAAAAEKVMVSDTIPHQSSMSLVGDAISDRVIPAWREKTTQH
jgi:ribose-phosphate pyrophosphokinase